MNTLNRRSNERFIAEIADGTLIGFKYFDFQENTMLQITYKGEADGVLEVYQQTDKACIGTLQIKPSTEWQSIKGNIPFENGIFPLYLIFRGKGQISSKEISF